MTAILASIAGGFAGILRFSGRDSRAQFWPYALFIVFLNFVAAAALIVPALFETFARMQRFAAEHPELTTVESGPGHYSIQIEGYHPELMPDMTGIATGSSVVSSLTALLLAAAVTRRLHDRDRRGWWGAMPLPFLLFAALMMPRVLSGFRSVEPPVALFFGLFLNNALYLAALAALVVLLVGPGTPGPNRFGEPLHR